MDERIRDFLGRLSILFRRSEVAYSNYLHKGETLLYALVLKEINHEIRALLLKESHLLPKSYRKDAISLIEHIDIWWIRWDDHRRNNDHKLDDVFNFYNDSTFPRDSQERIEALYENNYDKNDNAIN